MAKSPFTWKNFVLLCLIVYFIGTQLWLAPVSKAGEPKDELRVLFIGNSLTYTNDLPAIVAALAETAGQRNFVQQTIAFPDFSLEDHWQQGDARKAIAGGKWDVVVLQQGPSALPESRALLIEYTRRFDAEIKKKPGPGRPFIWSGRRPHASVISTASANRTGWRRKR